MATENQQVTIDMKDLPGILSEAIKGMEFPQILALKEEMKRVEHATLFPGGDGALLETCGKSIIDTRMFYKDFRQAGGPLDAVSLARGLGSRGNGPWISLSPAMQKFANVLKCRGDYNKAQSMGFDIREYSSMVEAENVKVTGPLTTTDAGVLVPIEFLAVVIEFATAQSAILPKLWRLPLGSQTLRIPRLVQAAGSYFGGIHLYHPGEAMEKTKTKPVFDYVQLSAKKLIGLIALTDEVIADSAINIVNYVTSLFVRAFQWETEHEVISGLGTGDQMLGILSDPNVVAIPRNTAGQIVFDDVVDLDSQLDENFANLTYISRKASRNALRKLKDDNKQPVYHDGYTTFIGGAMPTQLNGYPLVLTRNARPYGSKGDLILAALEFYLWGVRQNLTIDTSRDRYFEFDETAVRFVVRQDGAPGVPDAFTYLDDSTS
jgi:HK97 family phage major capsid protein